MTIEFRLIEDWDGSRDVVVFSADVNGRRVELAVSLEALQDNFGGNNIAPLDCFRANRRAIEAIAGRLIRQQRFEPDGSILIRSQDGP